MRGHATLAAAVMVVVAAAPAHARPRRATPKVTVDGVVAVGAVPAAKVKRAIEAIRAPLRRCHQARQGAKPGLFGGRVAATFTISAEGAVADAATSGVDADVASCVATALAGLTFPATAAATTVTADIRYAVPADKVRKRIADMTRSAFDTSDHPGDDLAWQLDRMAHPPEYVLRGSSGGGGSYYDVGSVMTAGEVHAGPPAPAAIDAALGVVRAHGDALRACLSATAPTARFTLSIAAPGAVTAVVADHGVDATTTTCLTAAAKAMRFPPDTQDTELAVTIDRQSTP